MEFKKEELIKSPMNFQGGKFKLLPQILPLFPDKINTFVDLFCGGLDLCLNVKAEKYIANDIILPMVEMYNYLKDSNSDEVIQNIESLIKTYNLNKTNTEGYINIRKDYNLTKDVKLLFPIICYCYNNQIRFNSKWEFNRHFGLNRSSFNDKIKNNLILMLDNLKNKNINFKCEDVFNINYNNFNPDNLFFYCVPEGTLIYQNGIYKPIEEVELYVTDLGNGNTCTKLHKRQANEEIVNLNIMGISRHNNLKLSKSHKVFVYCEGVVIEKKAEDLTTKDLLIIDYEKCVDDLFPTYSKFKKSSIKVLNVDYNKKEQFATLLGLFMAQGHRGNGLFFSYDTKKKESHLKTVEILKDFFGLDSKTYVLNNYGSVTQIACCSNELESYMLQFYNGKTAREKALNDFVLKWSPEIQLNILKGWLEGDGGLWSCKELSESKKITRSGSRNKFKITGTTTSLDLACQMYNIALRNNLHPCIKTRVSKLKNGDSLKDGRTESVCYDVYFTMKKDIEILLDLTIEGRDCGRRFHDEKYMVTRINKIEIEKFNGVMYDLTTKNGNFWCFGNIKVHNCDPPYLITQADYSIQASWNEEKENKLLSILDSLHKKGVKFALSNVLEHKDKSNDILKEWSKQYNVHHLNIDYSNCNASNSSKKHKSDEVLITNY